MLYRWKDHTLEFVCTLASCPLQDRQHRAREAAHQTHTAGFERCITRCLPRRYLFPEAVHMWEDNVSASDMAASLECCCNEAGARRAGLDLVSHLMTQSPAVLQHGADLLLQLHYKPDALAKVDKRWVVE